MFLWILLFILEFSVSWIDIQGVQKKWDLCLTGRRGHQKWATDKSRMSFEKLRKFLVKKRLNFSKLTLHLSVAHFWFPQWPVKHKSHFFWDTLYCTFLKWCFIFFLVQLIWTDLIYTSTRSKASKSNQNFFIVVLKRRSKSLSKRLLNWKL